MQSASLSIPSPITEGEVTVKVDTDGGSYPAGTAPLALGEQAVPLIPTKQATGGDDPRHHTASGPASVQGTETRSERSDDEDDTNHDALREAGLAIDPEVRVRSACHAPCRPERQPTVTD